MRTTGRSADGNGHASRNPTYWECGAALLGRLEHAVRAAGVGFRERDEKTVHGMVKGLGLICLLGGVVLTFVAPALFGAFPNPGVGISLLHVVLLLLGASSIAVVGISERVPPMRR